MKRSSPAPGARRTGHEPAGRRHGEPHGGIRGRRVDPLEGQRLFGNEAMRGVLAGSGRPLDVQTRAFMESHFGYDFGAVRLHTDETAAAAARSMRARAYTVGSEVVIGHDAAASPEERRTVLAHELAHVVQQGPTRPAALHGGPPDRGLEREADRAARRVSRGEPAGALTKVGALAVQCLPEGPVEKTASATAAVPANTDEAILLLTAASRQATETPPDLTAAMNGVERVGDWLLKVASEENIRRHFYGYVGGIDLANILAGGARNEVGNLRRQLGDAQRGRGPYPKIGRWKYTVAAVSRGREHLRVLSGEVALESTALGKDLRDVSRFAKYELVALGIVALAPLVVALGTAAAPYVATEVGYFVSASTAGGRALLGWVLTNPELARLIGLVAVEEGVSIYSSGGVDQYIETLKSNPLQFVYQLLTIYQQVHTIQSGSSRPSGPAGPSGAPSGGSPTIETEAPAPAPGRISGGPTGRGGSTSPSAAPPSRPAPAPGVPPSVEGEPAPPIPISSAQKRVGPPTKLKHASPEVTPISTKTRRQSAQPAPSSEASSGEVPVATQEAEIPELKVAAGGGGSRSTGGASATRSTSTQTPVRSSGAKPLDPAKVPSAPHRGQTSGGTATPPRPGRRKTSRFDSPYEGGRRKPSAKEIIEGSPEIPESEHIATPKEKLTTRRKGEKPLTEKGFIAAFGGVEEAQKLKYLRQTAKGPGIQVMSSKGFSPALKSLFRRFGRKGPDALLFDHNKKTVRPVDATPGAVTAHEEKSKEYRDILKSGLPEPYKDYTVEAPIEILTNPDTGEFFLSEGK